MSSLIVNADDFGYTSGVNRSILHLRRQGALSSTTVMATGLALPDSALNEVSSTGLVAGCHIVLVDGVSALDDATPRIPSGLSFDGRFRPRLGNFFFDLMRGRIPERAIELEAIAQIRLLQQRGVAITHVDTHKHTHMFPRVLRPVLQAALQCGIRAIRNPFEPLWSQAATPGALLTRRFETRLLRLWHGYFLKQVSFAGMRTTKGSLGILATGSLHATSLQRILDALDHHGRPDECYELVCHPGENDADLSALPTRLREERAIEAQALSRIIPRFVSTGQHGLFSFADLHQG